MILHSPLMSGMRVAFPQTKRTWFFDAFPRYRSLGTQLKKVLKLISFCFSIDKMPRVSSPVLVIHGTEDEVPPYILIYRIYVEAIVLPKTLCFIYFNFLI